MSKRICTILVHIRLTNESQCVQKKKCHRCFHILPHVRFKTRRCIRHFTKFCRSVLRHHLQHLPLVLCSFTLRGPRRLTDYVSFGATTPSQFKDPFKCGRRTQPGTRCILPAFPINATQPGLFSRTELKRGQLMTQPDIFSRLDGLN